MAGLSALLAVLAAAVSGLVDRTVDVDGRSHPYQVHVPASPGARRPAPVVLFLHGAGEAGVDGLAPARHALGPAIARQARPFPGIVVFPQCPRGSAWIGSCERVALAALERAITEFQGDRDRVVVTGLSLGGYGAWQLAARHPGLFAGVAPVAGGVVPPPGFRIPPEVADLAARGDAYLAAMGAPDAHTRVARMIGRTPVWIVHGTEDTIVSVAEARGMARALEASGGRVTYTELAGRGHAIADEAYQATGLLDWLVAQRREASR